MFHVAPAPNDAADSLGDRLTKAMKRAGLKNPEVASAAGVHAVTVSRWRTDAQAPEEAQLEHVVALLRSKGVPVTVASLRYGPAHAQPDAVLIGPDGQQTLIQAKHRAGVGDLPRQLELLALELEREMVTADVDSDFKRYVRARLRDPELLEMYAGGHTERAMTAEEQLADYEDLVDELRGRLKRRIALLKKRRG